jgi:hypothetical protein
VGGHETIGALINQPAVAESNSCQSPSMYRPEHLTDFANIVVRSYHPANSEVSTLIDDFRAGPIPALTGGAVPLRPVPPQLFKSPIHDQKSTPQHSRAARVICI